MKLTPIQTLSAFPQGSVPGPQLFSLYYDPLEDGIRDHAIDAMMYADNS